MIMKMLEVIGLKLDLRLVQKERKYVWNWKFS